MLFNFDTALCLPSLSLRAGCAVPERAWQARRQSLQASLPGTKQSLHLQIKNQKSYCIPAYNIVPLIRRGKGCYFWLDPKVTKRSSRKNPSTRKAKLPGPRFPAGLCPLLFLGSFNVY
jgi:hypothetical protein